MTGILKGVGLDGVTGILKGGSKGDTGSKGASTDIVSSLLGTVGNLLGGGCVDGGILQTVFDLLNNLLGGCATGGSGNQLGNIIRDLIATVNRIINILGGFRNCDAFQAIGSLLCTLAEVLSNIEDLCDDLEGILLTIVLTNFRLYLSILEVVECIVKTLARLLKTQRITTGLCNAVSHATTGLSLAINSVLYGVQSISCLFANPPSNLLQRIIQILGSSISCALVVLQGGVSFSLQDVAQILRQNSVAAIVDDLFECISASLGCLLDNVTGPILGLLGPLAILPTPFNLICSLINNLLPSLICLLNAGSPNFLTIM
ncbi:uncharacterized protein LOC129566858 [Sitodiplosis mosellana]|uniref:uncharacterized protein LOC129566858 n=1 Tax=Sitodiplosis mosellana TaxID=263140 RepID=UPI0024448AD1|nr:uncharacterized protein LOC129566858 [Sitodiplosis mosellana]